MSVICLMQDDGLERRNGLEMYENTLSFLPGI